jgi:uncharacterized ferritin-like protein (DUF455 family)
MSSTPNWEPFQTLPLKAHPPAPRSILSPEGIADRIRAAAFAELQAIHAFRWAAQTFTQLAPPALIQEWKGLALAEERHYGWLVQRAQELNINLAERPVSEDLWHSLVQCTQPDQFCLYMAAAEERGRKAGVRFYETILNVDPITAKIFGKIAEEEVEHIRLAERYYPHLPSAATKSLGSSSRLV